jgi:GNAT superfamily N-acetyltransferase
LVVTIGQGEGETIIGGARYIVHEDANGEKGAEIAFTVEEDYQGQGIASSLLRHLIQIARAKGLARLDAEVLASNRSMLAVFSRSGLPMKTERLDDVVLVTLALGA